MKKQTDPNIKAHLLRSAFYLLLLVAVCVIPFALGQRATTKQSAVAAPLLLGSAPVSTLSGSDAPFTFDPTLCNYPDTSIPLSTDTTVTPDATPINTTSINVSTSTNFNGTLEGDLATGVVRVTDAHPAGTYTVTVTAFDSGGASATKAFTLTVTTPATCTPVSFAAATNLAT